MSTLHSNNSGAKGGKDQFNWNTVKSDKDRECYLGHSIMAPTGRWQEGKDLTWYAKNREHEQQIKSAEFRAAKKTEEDALMTALGIKVMPAPPPPSVPASMQQKFSTKHESTLIKNEPMTPAIHNNSHDSKQNHQNKQHDSRKRDNGRERRKLKATNSDEEKNNRSEDDEEASTDNEDKTKEVIQPKKMTEQEVDEFLIDLIRKHGIKKVKRILKSKKEKKEHKRRHSSSESSSSESRHVQKKRHSHKEEKSKSKKHHRTRSSSSISETDRSKRDRNH